MSEQATLALREIGQRLDAIDANLALLVRALLEGTAPAEPEDARGNPSCPLCKGRAKNCPRCGR